MARTILALGTLLPAEMDELERNFNVIRLSREADPEAALQERRNDIVGIITSPMKKVNRHLIEALPNLEIISQFGVGVDNIDLQAAKDRHIAVTNTPDLVTNDTADIALSLLMACARRIVEGDAYVRVGHWANGPMPHGVTLTGKTVGVVGLGRIGQAVARRAAAFDMNVIYYGRKEKPEFSYSYYPDLMKLAEDSDFMILTVSGGPETRHLVNSDVLKALGKDGFLINVARGSVVDEEALLIALSNREIAGAGLDVFENEPHVPEALYTMDNVVLLPHIGTLTFETRTKMGQLVLANLRAHFNGEPLKTAVSA